MHNRIPGATTRSAVAAAALLANKTRPVAWLAGLLVLLAGAGSTMAGDTYWWRGASSTWGTASNWSKNTQAGTGTQAAPPGNNYTDYIAFNANNVLSTGTTCKFGNNETVLGVIFNNSKGAVLQQNTTTKTLTVGSGGITVNDISGAIGTVGSTSGNFSFVLGASQTWANNSSGTQVFNATGVTGIASTPVTLTLSGSNTGPNAIGGPLADGATGGTVSVIKSGGGAWQLTGTNSYTGSTTVSGGTLLVTGSTASGSAVEVQNSATLGGSGTINGTLTVDAGGTIQPSTTGSVSTLTFANGASPTYLTGPNYASLKLRASGTSLDSVAFSAAAAHSVANLDLHIDCAGLSGAVSGATIYSVASGDMSSAAFHSISLDNNSGGYSATPHYNATTITVDLSASASPTLSTSGTLSALSTTYGTASAYTSFSVSGGNLSGASGNLTLSPPAGYEVSLSSGSGYSTSLSVPYSGGTLALTSIYVRLAATAVVGSYSGSITISGGGSSAEEATVSSSVSWATPTVTVTVGSYNYSGSPQGPSSYTTSPTGDTGLATWSYQGGGYGPSSAPPTAPGTYNATVSIAADSNFHAASSSPSAFTINGGSITALATLPGGLSTSYGTPSAALGVSVSGAGLTASITATAQTGFEVSSDGSSYGGSAFISESGGNASGTLLVRLAAVAPAGSHDSQTAVILSSPGATSVSVATSAGGNTVSKVDSAVTTWPTASAIQIGQTLAASTLSGGSTSTDGTFAWTNPGTAPNLGTQSQSVTFTPSDPNFNTTSGTVDVTVQNGSGSWAALAGNWSVGANWVNSAIADGAGNTALFTNTLDQARIVTMDTSRSLGVLNIGNVNGNNQFTISGGEGATLTFDNGSDPAQLCQINKGAHSAVTVPILLNSSLNIKNETTQTASRWDFNINSNISANVAGPLIVSNIGTTGTLTIRGNIADGGGTLALLQNSPTPLSLLGTNTYSGGTTVAQGTLNFSGFNAQPSHGTLAISGGATVNLSNLGVNATTPPVGVTGAGALNAILSGGYYIDNEMTYEMSGFTGILDISGSGARLTMNPPFVSPAAGGTIRVESGTTAYLGWLGNSLNCSVELYGTDDGENLGQLRVENNDQQKGPVILKANSSIGSAGGTGFVGGVISDGGLAYGFAKVGGGTLALTGTNTYTGVTTVSNGTLLVNGSLAAGSAVTVNGGTLGGSGIIGGSVTVSAGGIIAPGASTDVLTVSGDVGLNTGSLAIAMDDTQTPQSGKLVVGGTLGIASAILNLAIVGTPTQAAYIIATYGGLSPSGGPFLAVNNLPVGYVLDYAYGGNQIAIKQLKTFYENWANGAAFDGYAQNDGVSNGLAWLLGAPSLPSSFNASGLLPKLTSDSGKLLLTFDCLSAGNRGAVLLEVQYSKDVGISDLWSGHEAEVPGTVGTFDVGNVNFVTTANGDLIHVVATIPASEASADGKLFARLQATGN